MRMPRVNIWLPEDLHREAKDLHLPLSELAQRAIAAEVERHRKAAALDAYLAELDNELGPATSDQIAEEASQRVNPPVLDAGGLSRLAERSIPARERLRRLRGAGLWPPVVPTVVLTEALRGDPRRDFLEERLLGMCDVEAVDEPVARRAAQLRTGAGRGSAVDAIVVAFAEGSGGVVLTQDPKDLKALATQADPPVLVERV